MNLLEEHPWVTVLAEIDECTAKEINKLFEGGPFNPIRNREIAALLSRNRADRQAALPS